MPYYKYYLYQSNNDYGFVFPDELSATIIVADGQATYQPTDGSSAQVLSYANGNLTTSGATKTSGIDLRGIYREMAWEGKPDTFGMCWLGTNNGNKTIAQTYTVANGSLVGYLL